jgi:tetraacyldisaccharide 4'-kinase
VRRYLLQIITGRRRGLGAAMVKPILTLLSFGYRMIHGLNRILYAAGLRHSVKLPVPVVSVGNVTTGGTGKTPFVEHLARWFETRGLRVAILSRGYGRIPGAPADDEALGGSTPNIGRFTNPNRARLARQVLESFKPNVILLDDGFQHYRIRRDLDILLVDAVNPFANGRILPRGLLREPRSAVKRADLVVITRSDQVDPTRLETIRSMLARLTDGKPMVEAAHKPIELEAPAESRSLPLEWLRTRELVAFSGIGNPEAFRLTLESLGARIVSHATYPDHHLYLPEEIRSLCAKKKEFMAEGIITTRKDAARLKLEAFDCPLYVLKVEMRITGSADLLEKELTEIARPSLTGSTVTSGEC